MIELELIKDELILTYGVYRDEAEYYGKLLKDGETIRINNTFFVDKTVERENDFGERIWTFCIGQVENGFIKLNSKVIGTRHTFYFSETIDLKQQLFVAPRNISILSKIDAVIEGDFYVYDDRNGLPQNKRGVSIRDYKHLLTEFPKTAELNKYAHNRIAKSVKEFFPESSKYEEIYENYMKHLKARSNTENRVYTVANKTNLETELAQFTVVVDELKAMLAVADGYDETEWQEKIVGILCFLYPKYILCTREVLFDGVDGYKRKPDFVMVDANGFIDFCEIKKPDVKILTDSPSYRNNYVPLREFSGGIQQLQKYIYCVATNAKSREKITTKLNKLLPAPMELDFVNPQGIFIAGRSNDFDGRKKRDFELIKRQYKNVADIMTYDDLLDRLGNVVKSLRARIDAIDKEKQIIKRGIDKCNSACRL